MGRVPSTEHTTVLPDTLLSRPESIISEGFVTSLSPLSSMLNTPISLVEPKRFFIARRMR